MSINSQNFSKILICDDEKWNCDIIYGFLMILGVKDRHNLCDFAYNGEQALQKVQDAVYNNDPFRYSLILMDLNMQIMDGYTSSSKIRHLYNQMDI